MAKKKEVKKKVTKPAVKKASIQELLKQLETCEDQLEKRKIRAKLRKAGHAGGIGATGKKTKPIGKADKKAKAKKSKVVDEDDDD